MGYKLLAVYPPEYDDHEIDGGIDRLTFDFGEALALAAGYVRNISTARLPLGGAA